MNKYLFTYLLSILTLLSGCVEVKVEDIGRASIIDFSFHYTGPETYAKNTTTINLVPTTSAPGFSNFTTTGILPPGVSLDQLTGAISGTPTQNLVPTVFTITATAPNGNSVSTQVRITVNDSPVISSVTNFTINEDTASGAISFNISDVDDTLTCNGSVAATSSNTSVVSNSTLVIGGAAPNCTISFSPVVNHNGLTTITLVANDTHSTSSSSFDVTVSPIDDAPVSTNIVPATFNEDTQSIVTLSYTDVESDLATACGTSALSNISVTQACACAAGICTVGVTGTSNYNGAASFSYSVTANGQASNSANATLTITSVNDAPIASNITPAAFNEDTQSIITLPYSDTESDQATTCSTSGLSHITVTQACACVAGICTVGVTGTSNYNGAASFNFSVTANGQASNSSSASLSISSVDDAPVAGAITPGAFNEDTQSIISLIYTDPESDQATTCNTSALSHVSITQACACAAGICTVGVTGTSNYNGAASFSYTVTANGQISSSATANLTVTAVDDAPVAILLTPAAFNEDTESVISLSYSDAEGDLASSCSLSSLTNITVSSACTCALGSCSVGVKGTTDYNGTASFSYTVTTGLLVSNSAPVSLTISAVNDPPVMAAISAKTVTKNTATSSISVTVSDVDSTLTCGSSISMSSSNTSLVINTSVAWSGTLPNCTAVVTPVTNVIGTLNISFSVTDGTLSSSRTFALTIEPIAPSGLSYGGGTITKDRGFVAGPTLSTGSDITFSVLSGTLPAGLNFDATTGYINGEPTTVESQTITIKAENSKGSATSTFNLNVIEVAPAGLSYHDILIRKGDVIAPRLLSGSKGTSFTILTGSLPAGLSLNATTGVISGLILTGHHNKEFPLSIRICNGAGCSDESVVLKTTYIVEETRLATHGIGSFTGYEATYSKMVYVNQDSIQELEASNPTDPSIFSIGRQITSPSGIVRAYAHDLNNDSLKEIVLLTADDQIYIYSIDTHGDLELSKQIATALPVGTSTEFSGSLDFGDLVGQDGKIDVLLTTKGAQTGIEIFSNPGDGTLDFFSSKLYSTIFMQNGTDLLGENTLFSGTAVLDFNADGVLDIALTNGPLGNIGIIYGPITQLGVDISVNLEKSNPVTARNSMGYGFDLKAKPIDNVPGDEIILLGKKSIGFVGSATSSEIDLSSFFPSYNYVTGLTITPSAFFIDFQEPPLGTNRTVMFSPTPQMTLVPGDQYVRDIPRAEYAAPFYFERLDLGGVSYSGLLETSKSNGFVYRLQSP